MMSKDISELFEMVRHYPAAAERVVKAIAKLGNNTVSTEFIERATELGSHELVRVPQILRAMVSVGLINEVQPGMWTTDWKQDDLINLSFQLEGAARYQRIHKDKDEVQVVLTLPEEPSKLCDVLPKQGPYCAKLGATDSVFEKIAREARFRLVIVTPFIDKLGAEWMSNMFKLTDGKNVERILILRDYHTAKSALSYVAQELIRLQVKMLDYYISHNDRRPRYETFHAKFVLGDDEQAYIGSANMLASSLELALEVGVLAKGRSVIDIKRLVDSMIEVATPINQILI